MTKQQLIFKAGCYIASLAESGKITYRYELDDENHTGFYDDVAEYMNGEYESMGQHYPMQNGIFANNEFIKDLYFSDLISEIKNNLECENIGYTTWDDPPSIMGGQRHG